MIIVGFVVILLITGLITNKKNEAKPTDETLEFTRKDSLIIFVSFLSSILVDKLTTKFFNEHYTIVAIVSLFIYLLVLILVNANREKFIKYKQDQIIKVFQALSDIFGRVKPEEIDFSNIPFQLEEDKETR